MHQLSLGELGVFFSHFSNLGYAIVSRDDNLAPRVRGARAQGWVGGWGVGWSGVGRVGGGGAGKA